MEAQLILTSQDGAAAASSPAEPARGWAGCRLHKAAALMVVPALLAVASLSLLWAQPPQDRSGASSDSAQPALATLQADQEVAPGSQRFVQQPMAALPGIPDLQMSVEMMGLESGGAHVLGHLVKVSNPIGRVSMALPPGGCGTREKTSVTAQKHSPRCRLAINTGYFNVTDGACIGNLVSDGVLIQSVPLDQSSVNFGIKDGTLFIGYLSPAEMAGFQQLVSGVTWLVRDGKNYVTQGWKESNITVQTSGDKYATNLASRTAVGVDKDGRLVIIQIDGSIAVGKKKRGVDMRTLADLLIDHGAVHAINLDGGGSSAMAQDGVLINYPSDMLPPSCTASGKYQCERPVSTVMCIHDLPEVEATHAEVSGGGGMAAPGMLVLALVLGALVSGLGFFLFYGGGRKKGGGFARQVSAGSSVSSVP